jgi:ADP-heptose:LPS heptosyltransferase
MASLIKVKKTDRQVSLKKFFEIKNKILILRTCGGYGDILNMRMIFEDLKKTYPDFDFYWAVPHGYFQAAGNHPYVKGLIDSANFKHEDYFQVYNLSYCCSKYEWTKGKYNDKNRADIWASFVGIDLEKHDMHMPNLQNRFTILVEKLKALGWDGQKKLVSFAPRSALSVKNLPVYMCEYIKKMTKDYFLFILHNIPILELLHLQIPILTNLSLEDSMATIQLSDFVISTDTGHLHCSGGYKKPTLGVFCYTDGYNISKYYDNTIIVQKHYKYDDSYCGPCNNYANCTVAPQAEIKPCMSSITPEMLENAWKKVLIIDK